MSKVAFDLAMSLLNSGVVSQPPIIIAAYMAIISKLNMHLVRAENVFYMVFNRDIDSACCVLSFHYKCIYEKSADY